MISFKCNICGKALEADFQAEVVVCPVCRAKHRIKTGDQKISPEISPAEAERLKRERQAETERRKAARRSKKTSKNQDTATSDNTSDIDNLEFLYNRATSIVLTANSISEFEEAAGLFLAVGGYKQADILAQKCLARIQREKAAAYNQSPDIGDTYLFGKYPQTAEAAHKEDIEWLVLDKKDNRVLLLSKYGLDCQPYHAWLEDTTWETCDLRAWLNSEFMDISFSQEEKSMISPVTVSPDENPLWESDPGKATKDQVFLLSVYEAENYLKSDEERQCKPTAYAEEAGAIAIDPDDTCYWWLRTPGGSQDDAARVYYDGDIDIMGSWVNDNDLAVRPALWIDLGSK